MPQFSSVQWFSCVRPFVTPWTAAHQASPSITNSWSLLNIMSIELVMPSNHLILCHPLLLLPSIYASRNQGKKKKNRTKPKVSGRKEIMKIRAKTNEIETRKPIEKINETNSWFFEKIKLTNISQMRKNRRSKSEMKERPYN